jgi:acetyl-CoA carboxylase biotin carboxyl carrier protein
MSVIPTNITGTVYEVNVQVGSTVEIGDEVVIIESMKMELPIEAEIGGTVAELLVAPGDTVETGQALIRLS